MNKLSAALNTPVRDVLRDVFGGIIVAAVFTMPLIYLMFFGT